MGHGVSVIVLQVVAAVGMIEKGDLAVARERLLATERAAREALAEMRRLLGLLDEDDDASLAPQPRLSDLDQHVARTRAGGVAVELAVQGDPVDLPAGLELAVYRVAQEALTNVIKARAGGERECAAVIRTPRRRGGDDSGSRTFVAANSPTRSAA